MSNSIFKFVKINMKHLLYMSVLILSTAIQLIVSIQSA